MKKLILLLLIVNCSPLIENCLCQWIQMSNGMGGNITVSCFTVSGNNIFAGTGGQGIYLSTNYGSTWTQTSLNDKVVYALVVCGNNIVTGTAYNGIYVSTNNGNNWTPTGFNSTAALSLAVGGNNIFTGIGGLLGVHKSTNNGFNWTQTALNNKNVYSLGVFGNSIFAGTDGNGIYLSTNNGLNWIHTSLQNQFIWSFANHLNNIFAGTYGDVFLSTNNGTNWIETNLNHGTVYALAINGNYVYAGTSDGVYFSTNNGENWFNKNQGFITTTTVKALCTLNNFLFAGITGQSVWRLDLNFQPSPPQLLSPANNSTQNLLNLNLVWNKSQFAIMYNVILATDASFNNIIKDSILTDTTLAVSNLNTLTNYYWKVRANAISEWSTFSNYFTFRTGSPWTPMYSGIGSSRTVKAFSSIGNNIFAGTTSNGVYKSTNNGLNWTSASSGLTNQNILSLTANSNILYTGTSGGGIFQSTNNGDYWIAVSNGLGSNTVYSLLSKGTSVFAGTLSGVYVTTNNGGIWTTSGLSYYNVRTLYLNNSDIFAGTYGSGVYLSTDNGMNWESRNNGLGSMNVYSIVVNGSNLYAGTSVGVYLSTNYGLNWTSGWLTNQTIYSLAVNSNRIFAGSNSGSLVSFDNGLSWININVGFSGVNNVYAYLLNSNYIFAGTDNSVWRRVLSEVIGIKNISTEIPTVFSLLQNYPNPFNPNTKIRYNVASAKFVKLIVYDILGKEIATLVNEKLQPGTYEVTWDGSQYPSGVYFYKLETEKFSDTKKMVLLK